MSPEQARREPLDPRTDIFTCGILLWEMLVGASLFTRGDEDTTIAAVLGDAIPRPSQRAPDVPAELEAVCLRALERDRERRWPTAHAFLGALGHYLYALDPAVTSASISALVSELCPDVPTRPAEAASSRPQGSRPGVATTPMERRVKEQILATHVEFEKILTRATGAVPVLRKPIGVTAPSQGSSGARWVILVVLAGAAAVGAGLWVTRAGPERNRPSPGPSPPPALADAAELAASSPDAAPAPAPPDAAPPRPTGKGRLVVGIEGAPSADVYVDGRRVGSAPFVGEVPAGRRRVKVVCVPEVCPPHGVERSQPVDVPAGGEARHVFTL
jgi:serine/threonine-protein kinase